MGHASGHIPENAVALPSLLHTIPLPARPILHVPQALMPCIQPVQGALLRCNLRETPAADSSRGPLSKAHLILADDTYVVDILLQIAAELVV